MDNSQLGGRRRIGEASELSARLARGLRAGCQRRSGPWNSRQPMSPHAPAPSRTGRPEHLDSTPPPSANKRRPSSARPPEQRLYAVVAPEAAPVRQPGPRGGMDPRPRRLRRSCCPLVSVFLRDPSSGRVYRRGKLIGKVGTPALKSAARGPGGAGVPAPLSASEIPTRR